MLGGRNGCDPVASYEAMTRAVDYCRKRKGPALVHAHVTRPYSHSLSDDEVLYKPPQERDADLRSHGGEHGAADRRYLANGDLASGAINKGLDIAQRVVGSSRLLHCNL